MKQLLFLFLILIAPCAVLFAQTGNEWIDYDATYYKIRVAEDGIYRVGGDVLVAAGLVNPHASEIRLYKMGEEVPVYISTDGIINADDYVEFYGEMNRGDFDRRLYAFPDSQQLNPYYSMFTDTAVYFLTTSAEGEGLRYDLIDNDLSDPPAPENYYMKEDLMVFSEGHVNPQIQQFISYSHYVYAEGFAGAAKSEHQIDLASGSIAQSGDFGIMELRFVTSNPVLHDVVVHTLDTVFHESLPSIKYRTVRDTIPADMIPPSLPVTIHDLSENGRTRIAWLKWSYPRRFNFDGEAAAQIVPELSTESQYFELENFATGSSVVYDPVNVQRIVPGVEGNMTKFHLPPGSGRRLIIASDDGGVHIVGSVEPRVYTNWEDDNTAYIVISSDRLKSSGQVDAYLDYRSSEAGGGYHTGLYLAEEIYDQFGYGIARHPQSIRNFTQFIKDHWPSRQMVFIIGKGIDYRRSRDCTGNCIDWFHVPTFGVPGADNLLFTLPGQSLPLIPLGRLPAINSDEVEIYLNKIKEYDAVTDLPQTIEDKAWTKNMMHLAGGQESGEQSQIQGYLNSYKFIAETYPIGGNVTTFTKTSTDQTGKSNSELIIELLEEGVSLVKFFGHSSASTLDFQINNPEDWNNQGKYPIFSAMGCSAGQLHEDFRSQSENFVFEPDAGAIAFVSGSGPQFLQTLGIWGGDWYRHFSGQFQETTLGFSIHQSLVPISQFPVFTNTILVEQQTLNGDPAIRFYPAPGRDYLWDFESVSFGPNVLTTKLDSFTMSADLINLGANIADSVRVRVVQELPSGDLVELFDRKVFAVSSRQTIHWNFPMHPDANGANRIYLDVDPGNVIEELPAPAAEENNSLTSASGRRGIDVFILDNRALATYPAEFSIVTSPDFQLIASLTNAFVRGNSYVMEMDTTARFNSPALERNIFHNAGGVIKWRPNSQMLQNTVYYWRVSQDSISTEQGYTWDESSFLYAPTSDEGWNQSHYFQLLKDDFDGLTLTDERRLRFEDNIRNIWIQNAVREGSVETAIGFINNTVVPQFFRPWSGTEGNVFVAVIDSVSGKPGLLNPPGGLYGAINPLDKDSRVFPFGTLTPEDRDSLMTFLEDVIPSGQFVILYTYQRFNEMDYKPEEWAADSALYGRSIFSVIEDQYPESNIRSLADTGPVPYTIFYRKDRGGIQEQIAPDIDATINVDYNFPDLATEGHILSSVVGPARNWDRVEWAHSEVTDPAADTVMVTVQAITADRSDTISIMSMGQFPQGQTTVDLTNINAEEYPFIQLALHTTDPSDARSTPQLEYWRVYYDGIPEFVFNPEVEFTFEKDSLPFGGRMSLRTVVENVSKYPSPAFPIQYTVTDPVNQSNIFIDEVPALGAGAAAEVFYEKQMLESSGDHTLVVELNPMELFAELHHFNNFGIQPFYVVPDERNPLLEVVFDGRPIEDGDVVRRQPVVTITLTDDNEFIPLDDPEGFDLFLKRPLSFEFEKIPMDTSTILFFPGEPGSGINQAMINWFPTFDESGLYTFRVQARDPAGNPAGAVAYEVRFAVADRNAITNLTVFPNPATAFVRFTFTLEGEQQPALFELTITDINGHTVRQWTENDVVPYVGTHQSDLIWDCTSQSGERVPQGLYFYQLMVKTAEGREYMQSGLTPLEGKIVVGR